MTAQLQQRLRDILACPKCFAELTEAGETLACYRCRSSYPLQRGVPVFLPGDVDYVPEHTSNQLGSYFESILKQGDDFTLHIGAGGSAQKFPNCVELEHKIFRNTDVVGDAHHLPLRDDSFDRVFAMNVFEHLNDPKQAAREILRVLKPGGTVIIHTAFLQALHEEPNHYYNATEFGVREWFSEFEIEKIDVSANFGPGVMLGYLMTNVLEAARRAGASWRDQARLSGSTIGEWAEFWAGRGEQPPGFETLQSLPQEEQKRVAAGFEMIARKPDAS
jgi:SAM-dependent methyltransferase